MTIFDGYLTSYCQLVGFSSCMGLSWMEISFLAAVAAFVLLVGVSIVRRVVTGIRD
jgi:hypothetical protein